jgi:mannose-6-phosphate isomerase-like protein (cupin superfamily)
MPLIHEGNPMPAWCELRAWRILHLDPGTTLTLDRPASPCDTLIVARGAVTAGDTRDDASAVIDPMTYPLALVAGHDGATVVRLTGDWGDETGGRGTFGIQEVESPRDAGDPVDYPKRTAFDAHYHDCDEYWIILEGRGRAVSEGVAYEVGPGDCIATGMGHHHDFPEAREPIRAVFFETTLQGQRRRGHLWEHTHGPAQPHPDRT